MFIASHSIAGGILGDAIGNPILAFLCGFILHFVLDAIPHEYEHDGEKTSLKDIVLLGIDLVITYFVWITFFPKEISLLGPFFWGALGGIFPDLMDNVPIIEKAFRKLSFGKKFHQFHWFIQKTNVGVFWGEIIQYSILALLIWLFK